MSHEKTGIPAGVIALGLAGAVAVAAETVHLPPDPDAAAVQTFTKQFNEGLPVSFLKDGVATVYLGSNRVEIKNPGVYPSDAVIQRAEGAEGDTTLVKGYYASGSTTGSADRISYTLDGKTISYTQALKRASHEVVKINPTTNQLEVVEGQPDAGLEIATPTWQHEVHTTTYVDSK